MQGRKHFALLAALLLMLVAQPLLAYENPVHRVLFGFGFVLVSAMVFIVVLQAGWERGIGFAIFAPAVLAYAAHYAVPDAQQHVIAVAYHVSVAAFLAYVLLSILRRLFRTRVLTVDDIAGALAGYLLTGVCWANLYATVWLLVPGSFDMQPEIRWQLTEWHARHALFDYYSMTVLASIGYGDITTTSPASNTLAWLEVIFGQFYLAVVVASIVGMKLAQATMPKDIPLDK
jgi:hypothetical protein